MRAKDKNFTQAFVIETNYGDIDIAVYPNRAPATVDNFLSLVENNAYKDSRFYRAVNKTNQGQSDMELIQGGLAPSPSPFGHIVHEHSETSGLLHKEGVISMARFGPGTASSEFFICLKAMPMLDFNDGKALGGTDGFGYASFGCVTQGLNVATLIQHQACGASVPPLEQGLDAEFEKVMEAQLLKEPVTITNIIRR